MFNVDIATDLWSRFPATMHFSVFRFLLQHKKILWQVSESCKHGVTPHFSSGAVERRLPLGINKVGSDSENGMRTVTGAKTEVLTTTQTWNHPIWQNITSDTVTTFFSVVINNYCKNIVFEFTAWSILLSSGLLYLCFFSFICHFLPLSTPFLWRMLFCEACLWP